MAFEDKVLKCADCGKPFTFTAGEQEFYQSMGFRNEPKRCKEHRTSRRDDSGSSSGSYSGGSGSYAGGAERPRRQLYPAVCANCGKDTQVPFEPKGTKPVYCSDCFAKQRAGYS